MHLLLPLASILGIEAEDLLERLKQNAVAWSAIGLFALIGVAFLLVAANVALSDWLGPIWAPLAIAGAALVIALGIYLTIRLTAAAAARRDAKRRHAAERTALVTTAAITAVPMLLKSPLMRTIGIPLGGALAAAYFLSRSGGNSGERQDDSD